VVQVRRATPDDIEVISGVLGEIVAHYGSRPTPLDQDQLITDLFTDESVATCLLAVDGDDVLGLAACTFRRPAAASPPSFYVKELFVRPSARRRGVAGELLAAIQAAAVKAGCSRVEWTADRDDPAVLAFYAAYGAQPSEGEPFYRVEL
jgi:GNAT superfamily N-acetyltransferase